MTHLATINAFFAAYVAKDVSAIRDAMADDVVWRFPGHHPLAGEHHGIAEVLALFDRLATAGFQPQPIVIVESGDFVIDHHRVWSAAGGGLDVAWCVVYHFRDGKISEAAHLCSDQHRADLFFNTLYRLKPVPDRLA